MVGEREIKDDIAHEMSMKGFVMRGARRDESKQEREEQRQNLYRGGEENKHQGSKIRFVHWKVLYFPTLPTGRSHVMPFRTEKCAKYEHPETKITTSASPWGPKGAKTIKVDF